MAIVYCAKLHGILDACPLCRFKSRFNKEGFGKETGIKLPATNGYDNHLKIQKQRYKCDNCGGMPVVPSPDLEEISEKVIAFIIRLSHSSVHRITNEEQMNYHYDYSDLPYVLRFVAIRVVDLRSFNHAFDD
ncbi:hypothetical protein EFL50_00540 [Weissella cibaria]|nr:hypothetical protein [Weissella cibaria]